VTDESDAGELTLDDIIEFGAERIESELDGFDGDMPNHGAAMLASAATDLLQSVTNIRVEEADESADDPSADAVAHALEEDMVDVLLAVTAVAYEYDLDVSAAMRDRMQFVSDFEKMQSAVEDADSQTEMQAAVEEHMSDHDQDMVLPSDGITPGDNVDRDEYDPDDDRDRHIA
jgi:NTP pyrophosphatase (non-canonical NTP hydrolase)